MERDVLDSSKSDILQTLASLPTILGRAADIPVQFRGRSLVRTVLTILDIYRPRDVRIQIRV